MTNKMFTAKLIILGFKDVSNFGVQIFNNNILGIYIYTASNIRISQNLQPYDIVIVRSYKKVLEFLINYDKK